MKNLVKLLSILSLWFTISLYAFPPTIKPVKTVISPDTTSSSLIVFYFHTDTRCRTCHLLEEYAQTAIKNNFATELENKTIVWQVINVDREENKHYIEDFQLYTKSIIIEKKQSGHTSWKNLDKIWDYVSDQKKYTDYIVNEINAELEN